MGKRSSFERAERDFYPTPHYRIEPLKNSTSVGWTVEPYPFSEGLTKIESCKGVLYVDANVSKTKRAMIRALLPSERGEVVKTSILRLAYKLEKMRLRIDQIIEFQDYSVPPPVKEVIEEEPVEYPEGFGVYLIKFSKAKKVRKIGRTGDLKNRIKCFDSYLTTTRRRPFGKPSLDKWLPLKNKAQSIALEKTFHVFYEHKRFIHCNSTEMFVWQKDDTKQFLKMAKAHKKLWGWDE